MCIVHKFESEQKHENTLASSFLPPSSFFDQAASMLGAISFFFGEVSINTPLSIVGGSVCVRASAMQHNWPEALRNYESLHIFGCSWTNHSEISIHRSKGEINYSRLLKCSCS